MGAFDELDAQASALHAPTPTPAAKPSAFAELDAQAADTTTPATGIGLSGPGSTDSDRIKLAPTSAPPGASKADSLGRGALQGASLGFGDEGAALADTALSHIPGVRTLAQKLNGTAGGSGGGLPVDDPSLTYQQRRDSYRATNAAAQAANPKTYGAGELLGTAATALVPGAAAAKGAGLATKVAIGAAEGAGIGGANALGDSTADLSQGDVKGALKDTAVGAGVGAVAGAAGPVLAKGIEALGTKARSLLASTLVKNFGGDVEHATATPTFVKQLRPAVETLKTEVLTPEGMKIARAARKDPEAALKALDQHVSNLNRDRVPNYQAVDAGYGPVMVDDYTSFLQGKIKSLAGKNTPEAKDQVAVLREMIGDAADTWGAGKSVPSLALRETVTGLQNTAGHVIGSINESERSGLMHWRADVAKDFLDQHLADAVKVDPTLAPVVDKINATNRLTAAWLAPQQALKDRVGKLATKALRHSAAGAGIGATVSGVEGLHEGGIGKGLERAAEGAAVGALTHHVAIPFVRALGRGAVSVAGRGIPAVAQPGLGTLLTRVGAANAGAATTKDDDDLDTL